MLINFHVLNHLCILSIYCAKGLRQKGTKRGQELQMRLKRQRLDHVGLFRPYEKFGFEVGVGYIRAEIVMRRFN